MTQRSCVGVEPCSLYGYNSGSVAHSRSSYLSQNTGSYAVKLSLEAPQISKTFFFPPVPHVCTLQMFENTLCTVAPLDGLIFQGTSFKYIEVE